MLSTQKKCSGDSIKKQKDIYVKLNRLTWSILILLVGILPIINTFGNPRAFEAKNIEFVQSGYSNQNAEFLSQIKYGSYVLIIALAIVFGLFAMRKGRRLKRYSLLLIMSILFFKSTLLVAGFLGTKSGFVISDYVIFVLFILVALMVPLSMDELVNKIKKILLLYIYGSLICSILYPAFAIQTDYVDGYLLHIRLFGITVHSNILASIACLFLLIELNWYSKKFRKIHILSAVVVLVMTQSKTIWVTCILIYMLVFAYRMWIKSDNRLKYLFIALLSVGAAFIVLFIFLLTSFILGKYLTTEQINQIYTLTGRNDVWEFTIKLWKENPLFGYGPYLWSDLDMRTSFYKYYGWLPGSAHNQFFQSLGEAGILGAMGLIIYGIVLLFLAIKTSRETRGASMAIVILLLGRGITEVSFRDSLTDNNFTIHFFVFIIFIHLMYKDNKSL
ncbi:O-antigen ligase family protein [Bacillus paranthracis]|uniref:O-antigen ligase family protein n=1 Tax=Bacillus cereus group TaxID=86661 RepID=UPI001F567857|nr:MULTISPECIES: O-antigen ligase family protein [Bacillus cereus group]MCU5389670.1 O-antigen ligase family protein [Bacillus paranthracis]